MEIQPEFASIEAFVQFLLDDERNSFKPGEAQKVAEVLRRPMKEVIQEIKDHGFTMEIRRRAEVRGFTSNNHDLFAAKNGWRMGQPIGNVSRQMVSENPTFK